jgi:hypothetical protein
MKSTGSPRRKLQVNYKRQTPGSFTADVRFKIHAGAKSQTWHLAASYGVMVL